MINVLIDANVFVSAFINPRGLPAKIIEVWLKGKFSVVVSLPLLREITEVLLAPRIKLKYGLTNEEISKFLWLIADHSHWVTPLGKLKICRHPDDNLILETALEARAKYLISRDDDIKRDKKLIAKMGSQGVTILSVQSFLDKLNKDTL